MKKKIKSFLVNLGVFIITLIILVFIVEFCLNIFYPQKQKVIFLERGYEDNFDSVVGWTDYKDSVYRISTHEFDNIISINKEGYPDEDWSLSKSPREKRIIILGDSMTEAVQVKKEQRFSDRMEVLLNKQNNYNFSVLNFGMSGYNACNYYFTMLNKTPRYSPDTVILFFYEGNDITGNFDSVLRRPKCRFNKEGKLINYTIPINIKWDRKGFIERLSRTNIGSLTMRIILYSPISYHIGKLLGEEPHYAGVDMFDIRKETQNIEMMEETSYIIKGMDVLAKERNISFVAVLIPYRIRVQENLWEDIINKYGYDKSNYNLNIASEYFNEYLSKENILHLDLYPTMKGTFDSDKELLYLRHDGHLTEKGHEVIAKEVYPYVK